MNLAFGVELGQIGGTAGQAHAGPQAAHQLRQLIGQRALVGDHALDALGDQLGSLRRLLEVSIA